MKRAFLIPSLIAAGLTPLTDANADLLSAGIAKDTSTNNTLFRLFQLDHRYTLASHRSHSSHSSHSSHVSHRSSTGGGFFYTPPPAYPKPLLTLPGNANKFKAIVMQVQLALISYGYYTGTVDGVVGPTMRTAIGRMQADYGLNVTGTITPQVLDALKIVAQ